MIIFQYTAGFSMAGMYGWHELLPSAIAAEGKPPILRTRSRNLPLLDGGGILSEEPKEC